MPLRAFQPEPHSAQRGKARFQKPRILPHRATSFNATRHLTLDRRQRRLGLPYDGFDLVDGFVQLFAIGIASRGQ